mgnify:CR=1 FL=1
MDTVDERSKIPNLMRIGEIPSDMQMDYDTIPEDPVVNTQTFTRFVLSNRGFLDSNSKVIVGVSANASATVNALATLPAGVGAHALVDRVALRIGTTVVSEITDYQSWMGYKSTFIDNEINLERETYLTSRIMNHEMLYKDNEDGLQSDVSASQYGISTNNEYIMDSNGQTGNLVPQVELRNVNSAEFSLSVADLVPWLRFNNLPLYMFGDTQVSLEIHWTDRLAAGRMSLSGAVGVGTGQSFDIDTSLTQFYANYIFYPGEIMEQFQEQNRRMDWSYTDYRMNKRSFVGSDLEQQQLIRIGGNGRIVNKVVSMVEHQTGALIPDGDKRMLNNYTSVAPLDVGNNTQVMTTNAIVNNMRLYPIDRSSPSIHYHDVIATEGNVPQITRAEYSRGGQGITTVRTYNEYTQSDVDDGLDGQFFYIGYRLNQNARVNENGITLQIQYGDLTAADTYIHRAYIEIVANATLENGKFSTGLA